MLELAIAAAVLFVLSRSGGVHITGPFGAGTTTVSTTGGQVAPLAGGGAKQDGARERPRAALALTGAQAAIVQHAGAGAIDTTHIAKDDLAAVERATGKNLAMLRYGYQSTYRR